MNIVIVNYGLFNSNSGGHIAHFAAALTKLGAKVLVVAQNDPITAEDFGEVTYETIRMPHPQEAIPKKILSFISATPTLLHAWTPRGIVQNFIERITQQTPIPYLVHLEDNEQILLASSIGKTIKDIQSMSDSRLDSVVPASLTHPRKAIDFLNKSAGVTGIVESLLSFAPDGKPTHVLEPGVDTELFCCDLPENRKRVIKEQLYIESDALVVVYNGNTHAANHRDVFSLYTAIMVLRRRGYKINLIRTGRNYHGTPDVSFSYLNGDWVLDVGLIPRDRMIEILKIADFYIQPGGCDDFNRFRLPSKLPEFLSLGKPVILPAVNIGARLRDGENALLLLRGDGIEIADKADLLIRKLNPNSIGAAGRNFARMYLNWDTNASSLMDFYQSCHLGWFDGKSSTQT